MNLESLRDKRVAILGLGKEGQSTLSFLRSHGISVAAILDMAPEPASDSLALIGDVKYVGGSSYMDDLSNFDVIFRSPGVPRLHPKLMAYPDQNAVYSHMKLFFDLAPCPIVAVTGTKGKTTTASLIFEILKRAGKDVHLGGNIGEPPLNFIDSLKPGSIAVLEISSFQAQDLHKSPHVGVILNVTQDHLDDGSFRAASHVTQDEYLKAKAQLIANQTADDFAVLHPELGGIFLNSGRGKKMIIDATEVSGYKSNLIGKHNLENIAAAVQACKCLGIGAEIAQKAVEEFKGVPQRLEPVGVKKGIAYVNDSASTNPESTSAAMDAFDQPVVLIVGGTDKGLDYAKLGGKLSSSAGIKGLVVIGQLTEKILSATDGFKGKVAFGARNMDEIVQQANSIAEPGDVVLLSPGAASFDMFKNSKDRGNQFNDVISKL